MNVRFVVRTSLITALLLIALLAAPAGAVVYDTGTYGTTYGRFVPPVANGDVLPLPRHIIVRMPTYHSSEDAPESRQAPLLKPGFLPEGCTYSGMEFLEGPGVVSLEYSCVSIQEGGGPSVGVGLWSIPDDRIEKVLIGGHEGYYIDGMWMRPDGEDRLVWMPGLKQLVFEKDGIAVHIFSKSDLLTKQQIVEIAASLGVASD